MQSDVLFFSFCWVSAVVLCDLREDFVVHPDDIYSLWRQRKISDHDVRVELVASRAKTAKYLVEQVDFLVNAAREHESMQLMKSRGDQIEETLIPFRDHEVIDAFLEQFSPSNAASCTRFKPLVMKGPSRTGKTQKALSLFGPSRTLSVNCQGISPHIPSIKAFDGTVYRAIFFDEIDERQVLNNKLVFQSPNVPVTLGQSACNAFSYQKYLFGVPLILCSNVFSFTGSGGKKLGDEDEQWLRHNLFFVELPEGVNWFLSPPSSAGL